MRTLLMFALLTYKAFAAPAPLERRPPARPAAPPVSCVMVWCGVEYRATFAPGGAYEARHGENTAWVGSWRLDGRALLITESASPECPSSWQTYRIEMDARLRSGRLGADGGEVRFEVR